MLFYRVKAKKLSQGKQEVFLTLVQQNGGSGDSMEEGWVLGWNGGEKSEKLIK